jgi:hypothetical protein
MVTTLTLSPAASTLHSRLPFRMYEMDASGSLSGTCSKRGPAMIVAPGHCVTLGKQKIRKRKQLTLPLGHWIVSKPGHIVGTIIFSNEKKQNL